MINNLEAQEEKIFIANQIKNIDLETVDREMDKLIQIGKSANTIGPRSRIGNNIVDYFTFLQRLETKGKYDTNFFEFTFVSKTPNIDLQPCQMHNALWQINCSFCKYF